MNATKNAKKCENANVGGKTSLKPLLLLAAAGAALLLLSIGIGSCCGGKGTHPSRKLHWWQSLERWWAGGHGASCSCSCCHHPRPIGIGSCRCSCCCRCCPSALLLWPSLSDVAAVTKGDVLANVTARTVIAFLSSS